MSRVFQIGAAGGVGVPLTRLLTEAGHGVTGLHRGEDQGQRIADAGGEPVLGDLIAEDAGRLAERFAGHDAVVFSAGAHGTGLDKTTAIDGEGLKKAIEGAQQAGVRRFVLVSVFLDAGRQRERQEGFEHYMAVKRDADNALAASDLDWLIVRPGTLTDEDGTGTVHAGVAIPYGDVARGNVAAFIAAALFEPALNRTAVELTDGDIPVADAVAALTPRPAA